MTVQTLAQWARESRLKEGRQEGAPFWSLIFAENTRSGIRELHALRAYPPSLDSTPRMGLTYHKEKLKHKHRKTKIVMVGRSRDVIKAGALQFWWCVFWCPNLAEKFVVPGDHLKKSLSIRVLVA